MLNVINHKTKIIVLISFYVTQESHFMWRSIYKIHRQMKRLIQRSFNVARMDIQIDFFNQIITLR